MKKFLIILIAVVIVAVVLLASLNYVNAPAPDGAGLIDVTGRTYEQVLTEEGYLEVPETTASWDFMIIKVIICSRERTVCSLCRS